MTKSTFPNEWLQPLVNEKVAELNQEATKDFVTVEKKVFDVLQKNNADLMEKLEIAKEALRFYAEEKHNIKGYHDYSEYDNADWIEGDVENGHTAREALKEIEDA